jgi:hypothetical protein
MPLLSNNPITVDGKVFDRLAVYIAISPVFLADDLGPSMALRFVRYRKDEDGVIETCDEGGFSLNHTRLARQDEGLEQKVGEMISAIQDMIDERGL